MKMQRINGVWTVTTKNKEFKSNKLHDVLVEATTGCKNQAADLLYRNTKAKVAGK